MPRISFIPAAAANVAGADVADPWSVAIADSSCRYRVPAAGSHGPQAQAGGKFPAPQAGWFRPAPTAGRNLPAPVAWGKKVPPIVAG